MNYQQIIGDLKNKTYKPIYFLMGEEPYYIDLITNYIINNVLTESEKTFNQLVLYGKDTDIETIIHSCQRYPMMANHQVIIVKEAQNITNIENLVHYVEKPLKSTILVVNYKYKKLDKRIKIYKALEKNGVLLSSDKIYENKVPDWINTYLKGKKYEIEPQGSVLLTEFLGNDLGKIANELDKLVITLPENEKKITRDHIERNIGISKDYNNFELTNAITDRDVIKANRIVNYFEKNPKDNPLLLSIMAFYYHFSKLMLYHFTKDKSKQNIAATLKVNPFFVKDYEKAARQYPPAKIVKIISMLRTYDLKSKGMGNTSATDGELLRELVYKIIH